MVKSAYGMCIKMFDEKQLIMENADLWKMAQQINKKKLGSPCLTGRGMFDIPSSYLFKRIFKIFSYQINDF